MYKKTNKKSEEIIRLYKEGKMLTEITQLTSSSQPTVKKVLLNNGIDYNSERKFFRESTLKKVIELYKEGKSQLYIEQTLNLTRKTIRELLKSANVEYRSKAEQHHLNNTTEINHQAFDELTPEALYWIGMLYTDGHIEQKKEASIELTLHEQDETHLEKFKQFLKSNRKISNGGKHCKRLRVNSQKLRDRLVELGFTHNKSKTIVPHNLLKNSKDFWRGCIDGDGGLYRHKSSNNKTIPHVFFCGNAETVLEFAIFCTKYIKIADKIPTRAPGINHYRISYYGEDAKNIANYLYKDSSVYLERKYLTHLEFNN